MVSQNLFCGKLDISDIENQRHEIIFGYSDMSE